jgi:hypothetical protein
MRKTSEAPGHTPIFPPLTHPLNVIADTAISSVSLTSDNDDMERFLHRPRRALACLLSPSCSRVPAVVPVPAEHVVRQASRKDDPKPYGANGEPHLERPRAP